MVGTFTQPDFESQGGTAYKTNLDNAISVISDWGASFAPHEQSTPDMTIRLDAGTLFSGTALIDLAALDTATITAPSTNPRKDIVYLDPTGGGGSPLVYIGVQTGSEAASPVDPTVASGLIPIARINLTTSTTAIANTDIDDLRGVIWDQGGGSGDASGPASSTDNAWARFDGAGGKTLQNGGWVEDDSGNVTAGGPLNMGDSEVIRPKLKDYGETVNDLGAAGGGTVDIDLESGNVINLMITNSTTTFTFSNPPAAGVCGSFTINMWGGGTQTIIFPDTADRPGGTAFSFTDNTFTFTTDFATDDKMDNTSHPLKDGYRVQLTTSGTLPAGLSANTQYFVINSAANDFELSTALGGAAVNITDDGTGTHTLHWGKDKLVAETTDGGVTYDLLQAGTDMK